MTPHPTGLSPHLPQKRSKIPTKQHYFKIKKLMELNDPKPSVIYVKGKKESTRDDTDVGLEFRQESYFFYLTGVDEPDFQVIIDIQQDKIYLVAPDVPLNEVFWKGASMNRGELLERYDVDEIIHESELVPLLNQLQPETLFVLDKKTMNTYPKARLDHQRLMEAMDEARLTKFQWEIDLIRQASFASSQAHLALVQQFQPSMTEAHLAALFRWTCALHGVYQQAYLPIVASVIFIPSYLWTLVVKNCAMEATSHALFP
ncbi:hypothetical protein G6F56_012562 [Rhizopus delemar]|nr:hypothetical protein G6F56_012562 [Rhizopus delemar]